MPEEVKGPTLNELIDSAIEQATPASVVTPPADETPADEGAADESLDGLESPPEGDGVDAEGDESATADEEGDAADAEDEGAADEAGEDGTDAAAAAAAAAGASKSDADKQREKEAKALNDPIPKDVSLPTQQRMRELIKIGKESAQRAEGAERAVQDIAGAMQSCGITPPQYKEWLGFMSEFNSPDPIKQGEALTKLEDMCDRLAGLLGKERRTSDILAEFPDLAAAVTAGQTTRKIAMETALQRRQAKLRNQSQEHFRNEQQTAEQKEAARQTAIEDLNKVGAELEKNDKQYGAKLKILLPQFKTLRARIPHAEWKECFLELYRSTKISSAGSALASSRSGTPPKQPQRTKSSTSTGQVKPANVTEGALAAMSAALASGGRR